MKRARILELDGLRSFAIFSVMLLHYVHRTKAFQIGWVGVDLFFVISGFLITGILLKLRSDPTPYKKFYWHRALRIFPPYYSVLAITAVVMLVAHEKFVWSDWFSPLFFLPAIGRGVSWHLVMGRLTGGIPFDMMQRRFVPPVFFTQFGPGIGVYWSLAVEELFYLVWAPVVLKGSRKLIATVAVVPLFVCPILRGLAHTRYEIEYYGFLTRFDALAAGACVALLLTTKPKISKWKLFTTIILLSACFIALCVYCGVLRGLDVNSSELFSVTGYTLTALIFGCVVGACVQFEGDPEFSFLRLKPLVYIGTISYTMYLTHLLIYIAVAKVVSGDLPRLVCAALLTIGIAALSWKYFESPILRLRNWPFQAARKTVLVPSQP